MLRQAPSERNVYRTTIYLRHVPKGGCDTVGASTFGPVVSKNTNPAGPRQHLPDDDSHLVLFPYTDSVLKAFVSAVQFWWRSSAGHRLRPWRSPYLRWRVETYTGKPAGTLRLRDFLRLAISERRQMGRFFLWSGELKQQASEKKS